MLNITNGDVTPPTATVNPNPPAGSTSTNVYSFTVTYTDAQQIWACRAFKFAERGALTGVFDCLDPVRPPLHSLILWLGVGDPTFQGRLLPLLLFGAFALLFYQLLRRVAPRLAPWGLVWLLATDQVFKGQVSAYAGVPVMIAIAAAIAVASDDGALVSSRGLGLAMGAVAGATIALIRRDGLPEFLVAMAVLIWTARERRDLRLWLPLAGAAAGYLSWTLRPAALEAPVGFAPTLGVLPPLPQWAPAPVPAPLAMTRLAYGVQGQVFSHYGYGAFAWAWVIVVIWAARSVPRTGTDLARRLGLAGLALMRPDGETRKLHLLYGAIIGLQILQIVVYNLTFTQAQGRFLFPVIGPIALLVCAGLGEIGRRCGATSFPASWRYLLVVALAAGNLCLLRFIVVPAYPAG